MRLIWWGGRGPGWLDCTEIKAIKRVVASVRFFPLTCTVNFVGVSDREDWFLLRVRQCRVDHNLPAGVQWSSGCSGGQVCRQHSQRFCHVGCDHYLLCRIHVPLWLSALCTICRWLDSSHSRDVHVQQVCSIVVPEVADWCCEVLRLVTACSSSVIVGD